LYRASVDLRHPLPALTDLHIGDDHFTSSMLMGVESTAACGQARLQDCYVRGDDLVAQYDATKLPLRIQIYWRNQPLPEAVVGAVMLETLVSVQTDLLDSDPTVLIHARLPADAVEVYSEPGQVRPQLYGAADLDGPTSVQVGSAGRAFVFHFRQRPIVFAQWFAGADVDAATLRSDGPGHDLAATVSFFRGRVEKGVIRRCRLQAMLGDASAVSRLLHDAWSGMLAAPPPLTT
jgi:hypothetical protein